MQRRKWLAIALLPIAVAVSFAGIRWSGNPDAEDAARPARVDLFLAEAERCVDADTPHLCMNELVTEKAPVLGVPSVLEGLSSAVTRHPEAFAEQCHRAAHYLGEYAGTVTDDVDHALAQGTPFCQFGYYHGVVEGYARTTPNLYEELPALCAKIDPDPASTAHAECSHSLGHAVVTRTGNDVPAGLSRCRSLRTGTERKACGTGIFMSWSNTLDQALRDLQDKNTPVPALLLTAPAERRWEMCPPLDTEMADACVHFFAETAPVPPLTAGRAAEALTSFAAWCSEAFAGREEVIVACHGGIGRVAGGVAVFDAVGGWPGVIELCTRTGGVGADACTAYAYSAAAQFQPGMVEPACAAWDGRSEQVRECAKIRDLYSKVTGNTVTGNTVTGTTDTAAATTR